MYRPAKEFQHGRYDGQHSRAHARATGFSPGRLDKPPRADQQCIRWSTPYSRPGDRRGNHLHEHRNLRTIRSRIRSTSPPSNANTSQSGNRSDDFQEPPDRRTMGSRSWSPSIAQPQSDPDAIRVRSRREELQASSRFGTYAVCSGMNADHGSHLSDAIYFHDPTVEEVSQYDPHRYATGRTSRKDDADELRDSLNASTLRFVVHLSDDELDRQAHKYFVLSDPPALFNPYYLPALRRELANCQRTMGPCQCPS